MEDLRYKHKMQAMHNAAQQIALDCISTQSPHGSPFHVVHPYPSPVRLQHAFQPPPVNSPKMFYPKGLKPQYEQRMFTSPQPSPILGRALCLTAKDSPVPGRVSHLNDRFNDSLTLNSDTDLMVTKIGAMFPTVSDTHIKILLKKYHNREAVVISALQVEKHPLVTPGPLSMSPSVTRLTKGAVGVYSALAMAKSLASAPAPTQEYYLPFTTTPNTSPSLFRPPSGASGHYGTTLKTSDGQVTRQHSPKMKLKYLKSIFPKADEMMILEILTSNDNNVQRVSEELIKRGFVKKESIHKKEAAAPPPPPPPPVKPPTVVKTNNEKLLMLIKYQKKYPMIAERVITIALESVDYKDDLTEQILGSVDQEQDEPHPALVERREVKRFIASEPVGPILKTNVAEPKHRSNYNAPRRGPNPHLRQGPLDALLLADYIPWSGADPDLRGGASVLPEGAVVYRARSGTNARGPASIAKGPQGLAKGSTYHKNKKSAKIITN